MAPDPQFAALADPTRCRIVELLNGKALPVHALAAEFAISRPAVSRHLRVLKDAELVHEEKQGRENVYSLQAHRLRAVNAWLSQFWPQRAGALRAPGEGPDAQLRLDL
jgi:DNA-binding transcriptional ArsR family regulator